MLTRTRVTFLGILAALFVFGVACSSALDDGASTALDEATGRGEEAALPSVEDGDIAALRSGDLSRSERDTIAYSPSDAEAAAVGGEAAPSAPQLQGLLDRKIIQSTSIDVKVEEVGRNFQEIIRIAETAGGFVASSSFTNAEDGQIADLTIRVPADRYQDVLAQIRGMGEVGQESSDANDITEEFTDLQARLRTLSATEQRYLELLTQAESINDILVVQDRLDGVRGQIEQVQGRVNLLNELTDLATITAHLRPLVVAAEPPSGGPQPLEAAAAAWERSLDSLRGLATAVLVVGAFSWWLVPPLAALGFGARWWARRQQGAATGASI